MPMDRELYPQNWEEIAYAVKHEVGWVCEQCGRQCYRPGEEVKNRQGVLTVHHKNHNPMDNSRVNLRALCAPCHLILERIYKEESIQDRAIRAGQLFLPNLDEHRCSG